MTRPAQSPIRCGKCGAEVVGKFCADCGSAAGVKRDLSVKHFLREAAAAVTDVDSVLVASFRDLVVRPGALAASYLAGERHRYLAPFRVFLLCNLFYFFAAAKLELGVLNSPLESQMGGMGYSSITRRVVGHRLHLDSIAVRETRQEAQEPALKEFAIKYDGATEAVAKTIVVVLIPLYALVFQALYAGTRRYFAEHLVVSTHVVAFLLLAIPIIAYTLRGVQFALYYGVRYRFPPGELYYALVLFLVFGGYTLLALHRVYDGGWLAAVVRTVVVVAMIIPALAIFKFILFFATLYWIS